MGRKPKLPEGLWERDGVYYSRFRAAGRLIRKRLSSDLRTACELLNDMRARADRADFGLTDNDYSWATLKEEFKKWAKQTLRNPEDYETDLKKFGEYVTIKTVAQISFDMMYGFREWRLAQGVSRRTVNRQVGTIHNMLNKAVEWKRIGSNPIAGIAPLPHDTLEKERRALTVSEVLALFEASPEHLKPVWRMFMCAGIRHSELVAMKFADVDYSRKSVTVRAATSKNHKAREIPLDDALLATIRQLQADAKHREPKPGLSPEQTEKQLANFSRDHVFVSRANTPLRNHLLTHFYRICKRAGIEGAESGGSVDIHSLRVSFATLSIEHGANPRDVQAILGHGTLKMTMGIYSKATERGKRAAVSALPFASASAPENVIPVQFAHSVSTSKLKLAEVASA